MRRTQVRDRVEVPALSAVSVKKTGNVGPSTEGSTSGRMECAKVPGRSVLGSVATRDGAASVLRSRCIHMAHAALVVALEGPASQWLLPLAGMEQQGLGSSAWIGVQQQQALSILAARPFSLQQHRRLPAGTALVPKKQKQTRIEM